MVENIKRTTQLRTNHFTGVVEIWATAPSSMTNGGDHTGSVGSIGKDGQIELMPEGGADRFAISDFTREDIIEDVRVLKAGVVKKLIS